MSLNNPDYDEAFAFLTAERASQAEEAEEEHYSDACDDCDILLDDGNDDNDTFEIAAWKARHHSLVTNAQNDLIKCKKHMERIGDDLKACDDNARDDNEWTLDRLSTAIKQKNAVEEELRLQKHLTAMVVQENNFLKKTIEGHSKK
jgi:hypothetical protein